MNDKEFRSIFEYWTAVEILNPQIIRVEEDPSAYTAKRLIYSEDDIPWPDIDFQPGEEKVFFTVYLELTEVHYILSEMIERFGNTEGDQEKARDGRYGLGAFCVDHEGFPIKGTFEAASLPWGMGRLAIGSMDFTGFRDFSAALRTRFDDYCERTENPLTAKNLQIISEGIVDDCGWRPKKEGLTALVTRQRKKLRKGQSDIEPDPPGLLNSFFLEDLESLTETSPSHLGAGLTTYLAGIPEDQRVDLLQDEAQLRRLIAPGQLPAARWPSDHNLALMQQVAVNQIMSLSEKTGLFSVNGPPGTGKTTLLRDVVAAIVVERAKVLASYASAQDVFSTEPETVILNGKTLYWHPVDPNLQGHEIVVVSSNNGAVENVTLELPNLKSLPENLRDELLYFRSTAQALFDTASFEDDDNEDDQFSLDLSTPEAAETPEVWGLIAGALGRSANRHKFSQALWWDKEQRSIKDLLNGPPPRSWIQARDHFSSALTRVEGQLEKLRDAERICRRLSDEEDDLRDLQAQIDETARKSNDLEAEVEALRAALKKLKDNLDVARTGLADLQKTAPMWIYRFLRTKTARRYAAAMKAKQNALTEAESSIDRTQASLSANLTRQADLEATLIRLRHTASNRRGTIEDLRGQRSAFVVEGGRLGDDAYWFQADEDRQKQLPWCHPAMQAARAELFVAAMELHEAFAWAAKGPYKRNLSLALDLLRDGVVHEGMAKAAPHLLAILFTCVPVASTTFASFFRMFGDLDQETLGWLLIDEAGQALPQSAVGALKRSKRAIVVGDPKQIPPIVPLPAKVLHAMATHYNIPETHDVRVCFTQTLADRANPFGATVAEEWVGCPLRVHRRCDQPMFGISNTISYAGTMVFGTENEPTALDDIWGESRWIDVAGSASGGHWIPEEGDALQEMIGQLTEAGVNDPPLFVITPFRDVMAGVRRLRLLDKKRGGTIHTFQGKENDAVVLVLGGATDGARAWAGRDPNILNVAVTRAKKGLYVIGNLKSWQRAGYFQTLATSLKTCD